MLCEQKPKTTSQQRTTTSTQKSLTTTTSKATATTTSMTTTSSTTTGRPEPTQESKMEKKWRCQFERDMPLGGQPLYTPGGAALCGWYALQISLRQQSHLFPELPEPQFDELRAIWKRIQQESGPNDDNTNNEYFRGDQLALTMQRWLSQFGVKARMGVVQPVNGMDQRAWIMPHADEYDDAPVLWFNNNARLDKSSHWEGMRAREANDPPLPGNVEYVKKWGALTECPPADHPYGPDHPSQAPTASFTQRPSAPTGPSSVPTSPSSSLPSTSTSRSPCPPPAPTHRCPEFKDMEVVSRPGFLPPDIHFPPDLPNDAKTLDPIIEKAVNEFRHRRKNVSQEGEHLTVHVETLPECALVVTANYKSRDPKHWFSVRFKYHLIVRGSQPMFPYPLPPAQRPHKAASLDDCPEYKSMTAYPADVPTRKLGDALWTEFPIYREWGTLPDHILYKYGHGKATGKRGDELSWFMGNLTLHNELITEELARNDGLSQEGRCALLVNVEYNERMRVELNALYKSRYVKVLHGTRPWPSSRRG